jgi:hypothetical protein
VLGLSVGAAVTSFINKKGRESMENSEKTYTIKIERDEETNVWIATSKDNDIGGLVLESESREEIKKQIMLAVPRLLKHNNVNTAEKFLINLNFHEHEVLEATVARELQYA